LNKKHIEIDIRFQIKKNLMKQVFENTN